MFYLIALFVIGSVTLIAFVVGNKALGKAEIWKKKKEEEIAVELDKAFAYENNPKSIVRLYFILPPALAAIGYFLSGGILFAVLGAGLGFFIPGLLMKLRLAQRKAKFDSQILDAIMILSSSLKGGLSLLQAFEVLSEEMPPPMSQEIAWVVKENKIGKTLEESLRHLNKRMPIEELTLLINSILVARETGGDLTKVFSRLSITIRDNRKLKDNIKTLTLQGRLQGIIMSILPFLFVGWVLTFNRDHFDIMLKSDMGRALLVAAVVLQIVGMFLIKKFSEIKI